MFAGRRVKIHTGVSHGDRRDVSALYMIGGETFRLLGFRGPIHCAPNPRNRETVTHPSAIAHEKVRLFEQCYSERDQRDQQRRCGEAVRQQLRSSEHGCRGENVRRRQHGWLICKD